MSIWPFPVFANATLSLGLERLFGYPPALQQTIGHPVQWLGNLLRHFEDQLYAPQASPKEQRLRGLLCLSLLLMAAAIPTILLANALSQYPQGWVIEAVLATSLLAQKSLYQHVAAVAEALRIGLPEARLAVSQIVGRDPASLDRSSISRAALESLAENTSDGVVAPLFWYALLGLPGLAVYKAINTADSMIGHLNERYRYFGWAAAKLDDLANYLPARLTGLIFAAAAALTNPPAGKQALNTMARDARLHQSPNAGFPEAAMAGALNVRFGGPRSYHGEVIELPWMGQGKIELDENDIVSGLKLYSRSLSLLFGLSFILALLLT